MVTAKATPGKTAKATVTATGKTTVKATITVTAPAAAGDTTTASTAPAHTSSAPPTFTHGGPTTGPATPPAAPSTSPAAPAAGSCIVSGSKMVIAVVISAAAAAWTAGADINLLEELSGATQTTRHQVYLAAPLTPGATVTVTETANPLLVSCEAVGVVSVIRTSSLLLPRA